MKKIQSLRENIIYITMWAVVILAPVISILVKAQNEGNFTFYYREVLEVWKVYAAYLVIFLIHNFVLAPILVNRRNKSLYLTLTTCLVMLFIGYQYMGYKSRERMHKREVIEIIKKEDLPNKEPNIISPIDRSPIKRERPPFMFPGGPEIISVIIAIFLIGMNLGVKLFLREEKREKEMLLLEQQNLNAQLEYLKYQINPHFFMNTLNNIHALVDIDPEMAKQTIVQLSKMMRYVLYEGNKRVVPIKSEHIFIENYIQLMSLRYDTNKVDIKINAPGMADSDKMIPALLIINFIENAFKHGISYKQKSFIHIEAHIKANRFYFECHNSINPESTEEQGGVGLTNTRKRLDLLFGNDYSLEVNQKDNVYHVLLDMPVV